MSRRSETQEHRILGRRVSVTVASLGGEWALKEVAIEGMPKLRPTEDRFSTQALATVEGLQVASRLIGN